MHKIKSNMFSAEEVNTGRQIELDIAKGIAIIFMVLCHTFETLSDGSNNTLSLILDYLLGGPFAAPVFMFCMGMGISYSRNNSPKALFRRGLRLLVTGVVLNIFWMLMPMLIINWVKNLPISLAHIVWVMGPVDILQFAGLAFISLSLLKHFKVKPWLMLVIALAASFLGWALRDVQTVRFITDCLCGFFWRSHTISYFPLLNWFILPVSGYVFGNAWRHCQNKKAFYILVTPICCVISVLYLLFTYPTGDVYDNNKYYGVSTVSVLFFIVIVMAVLGICYLLSFLPAALTKPLCWMSQHITSIYCIHWVLIKYIYLFMSFSIPFEYYPDVLIIPMGFIVLLLFCLILMGYQKMRKMLSDGTIRLPWQTA